MTQEQRDILKQNLPRGYYNSIHAEINGKINVKQIRNIVNGVTSKDEHGVLELAIRIAAEEKKRREKLTAKIQKLAEPQIQTQ